MDAGTRARAGFAFQDAILTERILAFWIRVQLANAEGSLPPTSPQFTTEGNPRSSAPPWDIVQVSDSGDCVLEEVKSGALDRPDRLAFWRRVRESVRSTGIPSLEKLRVRLTVDPQATIHPANAAWRKLPQVVGTVSLRDSKSRAKKGALKSCVKTRAARSRVTTAEDLAREALRELTSADKSLVDSLSETAARALLARFEFDESRTMAQVEESIRAQLETLSGSISGTELIGDLREWMEGHLTRRGRSDVPERHTFSADQAMAGLGRLYALSRITLEEARAWQRLFQLGTEPPDLDGSGSGLAYQNWKEVQPETARKLLTPSSARRFVALTGSGGLGKSVLLRSLSQEARTGNHLVLHISGNDLRGFQAVELSQALTIGDFVARVSRRSLRIFVDGYENVADSDSVRKQLLSALRTLASPHTLTLTCRAMIWGQLAGTQESIAGWEPIELSEWSESTIVKLVRESQRPSLTPQLLRLLRTPLLLDIFLRAFGEGEAIPVGLQTRHHILSCYWQRRILPADYRAAARVKGLDEVAQAEALGTSWHCASAPMLDLASEGLFAHSSGRLRFRHAVLRDFALMQWLSYSYAEPAELVSHLGELKDAFAQYGVLRAVIEAVTVPNESTLPSYPSQTFDPVEFLRSVWVHPTLRFRAADVLGELDDPRAIPINSLEQSLSGLPEGAEVGSRILHMALACRNQSWAMQLAMFPDSEKWIEQTNWIDPTFFSQVSLLIYTFWCMVPTEERTSKDSIFRALAHRLRIWSGAEKFSAARGLSAALLVAGELGPIKVALPWLIAIAKKYPDSRSTIASLLPNLVYDGQRQGETIDGDSVKGLYLLCAGWEWEGRCLRTRLDRGQGEHSDYQIVEMALLGQGTAGGGLAELLPDQFLAIVFALLVFEHQHRNRETLEQESDLEGLIEDLSGVNYSERYGRDALVFGYLRRILRRSLRQKDRFVDIFYWPIARESCSATARILLLDLLTNPEMSVAHLAIVDEILSDRRLYHISSAYYYLCHAIALRWGQLSQVSKDNVFANLRSLQNSTRVRGEYAIGQLLSAVPESDYPRDLSPYMSLWNARSLDPKPTLPTQQEQTAYLSNEETDLLKDLLLGTIQGLTPHVLDLWRSLRRLVEENAVDEHSLSEAITVLNKTISRGLPKAQSLDTLTWPLNTIKLLLHNCMQHRKKVNNNSSSLPSINVQKLIKWALVLAASGKKEVRLAAIDLLDQALLDPAVTGRRDLNIRMFDEVERILEDLGPDAEPRLLLLHPAHWFQQGGTGRQLLYDLSLHRLKRPVTLLVTLRYMIGFTAEEQHAVLSTWLTEPGRIAASDDDNDFANRIGIYMGQVALGGTEGVRNVIRGMVIDYLTKLPDTGMLADISLYKKWLSGIIFGLKNRLKTKFRSQAMPQDFAELMTAAWRRLGRLPTGQSEERQRISLSIFAFFPIADSRNREADDCPDEQMRAYWEALEPLVHHVIAEAEAGELVTLVFGMRNADVARHTGVRAILPMMESLNRRLVAEQDKINRCLWGRWWDVAQYGSEMLGSLEQQNPDESSRRQIYEILENWAAMKNPKALEVLSGMRGR